MADAPPALTVPSGQQPQAGTPSLAPSLLAALGQVTVADNCRSATVGGRSIEASTPAELSYSLGQAIYEVLHVGWAASPADRVRTSTDEEFEARLLAATPHRWVVRPARLLSADPHRVRVELDGVRVIVPREAGSPEPSADGQVAVRLPSCRPGLSPGYFVADGTRALGSDDRIVRGYVHLRTAADLLTAWQAVLGLLEERHVAFRAKVTSVPALLPRSDALVVYLDEANLKIVSALADHVARVAELGAPVSAFAERVADGVAIAWEPADKRPHMRGLSFGEHRARVTAEGLVRHAESRVGGSAEQAVCDALISGSADPARPARNLERHEYD